MSNATRATVATFGTIAALAGIEHGLQMMLQSVQVTLAMSANELSLG